VGRFQQEAGELRTPTSIPAYTVNTFATHPWIFTDGPGNCVEMFVARAGTKSYMLKVTASGKGGD
jgi:hypothetical protein